MPRETALLLLLASACAVPMFPRQSRIAARQSQCQVATCVPPYSTCSPTDLCADSYCNVTWSQGDDFRGMCLKYAQKGGACTGLDCARGLYCNPENKCAERVGAGQTCDAYECKYGLYCSSYLKKCINPFTPPCGANTIDKTLKYCSGGYYCNYTNPQSENFEGVCLQQHEAGTACNGLFNDCKMGWCENKVCVGLFSLNTGENCDEDSLCKSLACSPKTNVCIDPSTPTDGTGPACNSDGDCEGDASCECNYKLGQRVCWGLSSKVRTAYKNLMQCSLGTSDPNHCQGKWDDYISAILLTDNFCSAASSGVVSFFLVLLALAFLSL